MRFKIVLFTLLTVCSLGMSAFAAYEVYNYKQLDRVGKAKVYKWSIVAKSSSNFTVEGTYFYSDGKKVFEGKTIFDKLRFLSEVAAQSHIKALEKQQFAAYYCAKKPQISSLQKLFPFKAVIHALLTIGVTVYFFLLDKAVLSRFYLRKTTVHSAPIGS